jgi:hypothetical protein
VQLFAPNEVEFSDTARPSEAIGDNPVLVDVVGHAIEDRAGPDLELKLGATLKKKKKKKCR